MPVKLKLLGQESFTYEDAINQTFDVIKSHEHVKSAKKLYID